MAELKPLKSSPAESDAVSIECLRSPCRRTLGRSWGPDPDFLRLRTDSTASSSRRQAFAGNRTDFALDELARLCGFSNRLCEV